MRRNWFSPRWYVTDVGFGLVEGPYPDTMRMIPADEPHPICSVCGVSCPDGGYSLPAGYMCNTHGREWHDAHPPSFWKRLWWRIDGPLDDLYWRYAERFGERVWR